MQTIKTVQGIEIFLTADGKFQATIKGQTVKRASLKAIENALEKEKVTKPVAAYHLREWSIDKPIPIMIKGFEKQRARTEAGRLTGRFETYLMPTEQQLAELKEIYEAHRELDTRWRKIVERAKRLTADNIETFRPK